MANPDAAPEPKLEEHEIRAAVRKRLLKYEDLDLLQHYAIFMGVVQILEFSLKGLMHRTFGVDNDTMERWTLGQTANELAQRGIRGDFVALLKSVVGHRNHIAHEFLVNEALLQSLLNGNAGRLERKRLDLGTYEVEQLMFLHDWCDQHNAWQ